MAHEITIRDNGTAEAAFAIEPAWHGLGTLLDHPMTSQEALTAAQLDWTVVQYPVGAKVPVTIETPEGPVEKERYDEIPLYLANYRSDNKAFLGIVTERYQVVQNTEAFGFLDSLIEDHEMMYESAFSLNGGRMVCLLGRLPITDSVTDKDKLLRYVLMSLTHDGSGAINFGPTSVRVVCANTHALALAEGHVKDLSIRHTGRMESKLNQARKILGMANQQFEDHADICKRLADHRMTGEEWEAFLDVMCPQLDRRDPDWTEQRQRRIEETRLAIRDCYHNERQQLDGIANTTWAAYNAVTEHIDHLPRRGASQRQKAEARFNVTQYGAGRDQKARAFAAACRFAGVTLAG